MKYDRFPSVSIILPIFNGENKHLNDTIESMRGQSYEDFELIIVDDGSTDGTYGLLSKWQKMDNRIRLLRNKKNQGLVKSLNLALELASTPFIARIDCGDTADNKRIEIQHAFLENNPNYVLVASQANWITMNGARLFATKFPCDDAEIRKRLFIKDCVLIHPSVMFRKIKGLYYRDIAATAEDYDYWLRLSLHGKLSILNEPLLTMRLDPDGTTYSKKMRQVKTVDLIHRSFVNALRNPHVEREWGPVKLNGWEMLQQRLFHLCTRIAINSRQRSKLIYYVFKVLSGITSPSYMYKLVQIRMRRLSISTDPMFIQYLSEYKG